MTDPAIAVVVVCHDSADDIAAPLGSVTAQLRDGDELVVVDNASRDETVATVREVAPEAVLIESSENLGFAGGCVAGVRNTTAPLVFFINPDAEALPGALDALRAAASAHPGWGAWQALVVLPDGRVNTAGNPVHFLGFAWAGAHGLSGDAGADAREIPSASGAALVVRRTAWDAVGGFDERYFMYGEDVDLSLRLRLRGWTIGLVPGARVVHDYAFVKGDYKWFYLERNRWLTLLRVYPASLLLLLAPALAAFELALLPAAASGGWLPAKLRAHIAVVRCLRGTLSRRSAIQASRTVSTRRFTDALTAELDSEFLGPVARWRSTRTAALAYWTAVRTVLGATSRSVH